VFTNRNALNPAVLGAAASLHALRWKRPHGQLYRGQQGKPEPTGDRLDGLGRLDRLGTIGQLVDRLAGRNVFEY
jgi:hypothetical protein